MSRVFIFIILVAVFFMMPLPGLSLAAVKTRHDTVKDIESCVSCHLTLKHGAPGGLFTDECATCHSSTTSDQFVRLAADNESDQANAMPLVSLQSAGLKTGMQGEMYYTPSRLGEKPNEMILIPAGEFIMGTDNRLPDEGPEHTVYLSAFYIDKYEVTNLQYKQFNDATNRKSPTHFRSRTYPEGKADHPVTFVSWDDADAYCKWVNKRLPSDAEWEKAARGTDGRYFPWGNEFDINKANTPVRWEALKQEGDTTPVGAFPDGISPYGIYDMAGNVWEWTSSWYQPYPGNQHESENYGEIYKVLKGGSWWDCSFYKCGISAPSYNRAFFLPATRNKSFGFRCAKDFE